MTQAAPEAPPAPPSYMLAPTNDCIVVEEIVQTTSAGGIILVQGDRPNSKTCQGIVVAVGPGKPMLDGEGRAPMSCGEGDVIVYGAYTVTEFTTMDAERRKLGIIRDHDVLMVLVQVDPKTGEPIKEEAPAE